MHRIKWTDRQFAFDFPVETYPELLERLRGTPVRVAERLRTVPRERLVRRSGSAWSMQEHAGHLADLDERLFLPRLDEYEFKVATLRAADMTNRATEEANHNAATLEAVLAELAASRARVMTRLEALEPDVFARTALHPRLGRDLRLVDLLYFHAEHDDYHLASITALLGS
ncbi:MAG: DinB family protein [Gemmatimonadales bacterium]